MMNASVKWPYAAHSLLVFANWPYTRIGHPNGNQVVTKCSLNGRQLVTRWHPVLSTLYSCDVWAVSIRLTCGQEVS